MMPKMDGFALCERLKKVDPDVKVCFLTSSEMYYEKIRGIKHYALNKDLFLQKPISTDDLIREINKKINSISNRGIKQGNSVVSQLQP
jgi:CheY-like chemotaxis protein